MNLKTTYHYSYFIYPFLVSSEKYKDFIGKFLSDNEWELRIRDNLVDLNTHAYFLPYVKKFLFPTLYWSKEFKRSFEEMSIGKKTEIVCGLSSSTFHYKIDNSQNNNYKFSDSGINFEISRIKLTCFEPGVCFLIIKTEVDKPGDIYSNDIIDFNHKFRTINPRYLKKKKTKGMFLRNFEFKGVEDLSGFIDHLIYGYEDVEKENIYFDRLFTYSYMCLDEKEWNESRDLNNIIDEFYRFQYVLSSDHGMTFDPEFKALKNNTYARWKYSIYGFSREAGVVFSSQKEVFNCTKLPYFYETMYFYIFLLAFYQRISLILFSQELLSSGVNKIDKLKDRFTKFTHFSWFSQITNSENGMDIWKKWQKAFDLPELFNEVQKEYEEFYDYTVARGQERINLLLIVIYTVSLLFSVLTLMVDFNIINTDNQFAKMFLIIILIMTIFAYPAYLSLKFIKRWLKRHTTDNTL